MAPTLEVLRAVGEFEFEEHPSGAPRSTLTASRSRTRCSRRAARRRGAARRRRRPEVGHHRPRHPRPEQGLLGLRKGLGLYANLRPVKPLPALYDASPLRRERIEGTDLLVVRELTGASISARRRAPTSSASRSLRLHASRRSSGSPARPSGRRAGKVSSVDKANVLETSRLWREVVSAGARARVPARAARARARRQRRDAARRRAAPIRHDPHREHVRRHPLRRGGDADGVDRHAAERLARQPGRPRPVRAGARLGAGHRRARAIANPLAMFLSAALMLRHGLGLEREAAAVESGVQRALAGGAAHGRSRWGRRHRRRRPARCSEPRIGANQRGAKPTSSG